MSLGRVDGRHECLGVGRIGGLLGSFFAEITRQSSSRISQELVSPLVHFDIAWGTEHPRVEPRLDVWVRVGDMDRSFRLWIYKSAQTSLIASWLAHTVQPMSNRHVVTCRDCGVVSEVHQSHGTRSHRLVHLVLSDLFPITRVVRPDLLEIFIGGSELEVVVCL